MTEAYLGIIEGFYGRSYSSLERSFLYSFMQEQNYHFYIYAPKADLQLRDKWQVPLTNEYLSNLAHMAQEARDHKLDFGIGFSPLNITATFAQEQAKLLVHIKALCAASKCEIFCLLFDDMHKTGENIGAIQNSIIKLVEKELPSHVKHFITCPSYYSDDDILDRFFGTRPEHYFEELVEGLPERVEIFWTGPNILSKDYSVEHLAKVTKMLGRKPFIWDNYPVNDGKRICNYLFLNKFAGRRGLSELVTGHAVNPMVQCVLSTLSEITLPLIYQNKSSEEVNAAYLKYAKQLFGKAAHELLKADNLQLLTKVGLHRMSENDKARLKEFCSLDDTPALAELLDFLNGSERFDQKIIQGTLESSADTNL